MSSTGTYDRFEELDAGRVLGDLSIDEVKEWKELAPKHQSENSGEFDWIGDSFYHPRARHVQSDCVRRRSQGPPHLQYSQVLVLLCALPFGKVVWRLSALPRVLSCRVHSRTVQACRGADLCRAQTLRVSLSNLKTGDGRQVSCPECPTFGRCRCESWAE